MIAPYGVRRATDNQLATIAPAEQTAGVAWNHVRTAASILSASLFIAALLLV